MDSLEQKIKEYVSSVEIPDRVKPEEIKRLLEDNGDMTAGVFLRKLKELKISGSDFLELLGNSKIGNMEFRRIEENPHLKFDELLQILDNSVLSGEDYRMIIAVATQRKELAEQRKRREEETLRRMTEELTGKKNVHNEDKTGTEQNVADTAEKASSDDSSVIDDNMTANVSDNTEDSPDNERISAAEALIQRMQSEIDSENSVENVETISNYTDSNTNESVNGQESIENTSVNSTVENEAENTEPLENVQNITEPAEDTYDNSTDKTENNTDDETGIAANDGKSATMEFCIPAPPVSAEKNEPQEAEDFDGIIADDEKIGSNAREIGSAIGELMDGGDTDNGGSYGEPDYDVSDDEEEYVVAKKSKGCLITSFVGAAVLVIGGLSLNYLRTNGIIPELTYDVPEKIEQNISDYYSLIEQAKAADGKISYALPDTFVITEQTRSEVPKNVYGDNLVAAVNNTEICGAKETDGKLSDNFSFETGLEDVGIVKCGEYFAVIGSKDGVTVIRTYDESGMISGKAVDEYILSGEFVDYYTNGSNIFIATKDKFDFSTANADKPETLAPSYIHDGKTTAVQYENLMIPSYVSRLNYYTATMITPDNSKKVKMKSTIVGDSSGCAVGTNGMYVTETGMVNKSYYSTITYITFDESLNTLSTGLPDVAFNPCLVKAMDENFAGVGEIYTNDTPRNTVVTTNTMLGNLVFAEGFGAGERIAAISGKQKTVTVTTYGDNPMQYNIDTDTGKQADKAEDTHSVAINDKVTAEVTVKSDKDGNRTGILLAVGGDKKAEVTIMAESGTPGDWNNYLTSPVCDDITQLGYYEKDGKIIIGIPVMYFDGISQVSVCKFYSYADGKLTELGNITLYDEKYTTLDCEIIGGDKPYILTMWDNRVITADIDKVKVISDTVFKTVEKKDNATESKTESKTESGNESKTESSAQSTADSKSE